MKRFIRYVYEYDNGEKTRNTGFVKVEQDDMHLSLHLHGRGWGKKAQENIEVYLFWQEGILCYLIPLGNVVEKEFPVNQCFFFSKEDKEYGSFFTQVKGLLIKNARGDLFAATWEDVPFDGKTLQMANEIREEKSQPVEEEEQLEVQDVQKQPHSLTNEWKRIERKDLTMLPKKEWKLANNSFLIHGYQNYQYLIYIKKEEKTYIGVPGVYHPKEAKMAELFGFPLFLSEEDLEKAEMLSKKDGFGYWCRRVGDKTC